MANEVNAAEVAKDRKSLCESTNKEVKTSLEEAAKCMSTITAKVADNEELDASWVSQLSIFADKVKEIAMQVASLLGRVTSKEDANREAFFASQGFKQALEMMAATVGLDTITDEEGKEVPNPATGGLPQKAFDYAFGKFIKPFPGEGNVPSGKLEIVAPFTVKRVLPGSNPTQSAPRQSQGQVAGRLHDNMHIANDAISHEVLWRAWRDSDEQLAGTLTDAEKAATNFHTGKVTGISALKRLEAEGKIANHRGYLQAWSKAQKMPDGSDRFTKI